MAALVPRVKTQASQTLTQAQSHPDSQAERERWREESSSGALSPDRVCCGKATERERERESGQVRAEGTQNGWAKRNRASDRGRVSECVLSESAAKTQKVYKLTPQRERAKAELTTGYTQE